MKYPYTAFFKAKAFFIIQDSKGNFYTTINNKIEPMTPKKLDNSAKAQKILEMVLIDCIKVIRPDLLDKQLSALEFFTESEELIFDRMVFDKLNTIVDLLQQDLGHINDSTRLMLSMDYEDALELFKRTL